MSDNGMRPVYLHALCREDGTRAEVMSFTANSTPHGQPGIDYDESYEVEVTKYVPALTDEQVRESLPAITDEDQQFLHYNPNTSDIMDWVRDYAARAIREAIGRGERG